MPKKYESEAKLFVRVGRENAMLDPTVMKGEQISLNTNSSREIEMNTIVEHLRSRGIFEKAFTQIFPDRVEKNAEDRERDYNQFKKNVSIASPRQSTIISVNAKGSTPRKLSKSPIVSWRCILTSICALAVRLARTIS